MNRFLKSILLSFIFLLILVGCSSMRQSISKNTANIGNIDGVITCYSGDKEILKGRSSGKIFSETSSDGWSGLSEEILVMRDDAWFKLEKNTLFEVTGSCTIIYEK